MIPVPINDYLNINNAWTRRLLGYAEFQKKRDLQQVENEYNLDKYAKLLSLQLATPEDYKVREFEQTGRDPHNGEITISFGDELFSTTVPVMRALYYSLIKTTVEKYASGTICELGCGYGFNLSYLGKGAYGGEYSSNAVEIARRLGLDVVPFNYYESRDYEFIRPDSTIVTAHSIEQIPDATIIIDCLKEQKQNIRQVIHFEPTVVHSRKSLLGQMRNKYLELNDYNRNLLEVLKSRNDIEILELKIDAFGIVPLNSSNIIVWKFKD